MFSAHTVGFIQRETARQNFENMTLVLFCAFRHKPDHLWAAYWLLRTSAKAMKAVFIAFAHTDVELSGLHTMHDVFLTFHWAVQLTPQIKLPSNPWTYVMTNCLWYLVFLQRTKPQSQVKRQMERRKEKNQEMEWKDEGKHHNKQEQILAIYQLAYLTKH